ncbi:hypothetical protein [Paenibacillus polymyxa]|uniref:hypothetical protein n=1 Tax=Paenibacillus polymyxa TaxID=1406 RepID=UPI0025B68DFE|nr:hypothetical protein [Paenibacillus polymyxa]MDN4106434.1 hypothetical protein [Paenibacillus polymyxa]
MKELQLVIEYVELPFLLTILELNIKKIKESNFKLGPLFELHLRTMQDRVSKEQYRVRQEMRRRGIKFWSNISWRIVLRPSIFVGDTHTN